MPKLYAYQMVGEGLVLLSPVAGEHPDHGLPGGGGEAGRPSHPISGRWPGRPTDPGYGVEEGAIPGHELPGSRPPMLLPGYTLVLLRGPEGKWKYAAIRPGVAPPVVLPEPIPPGGAPDQGLPPQPDQGLPGGPVAAPKR
jgi:hypothetical protein